MFLIRVGQFAPRMTPRRPGARVRRLAAGCLVGVAAIAAGRGGRKTALPFGPFMIAGALLAIFLASPIADWYVDLLG
jgi:prepilin signal peptidase PulO-like enzyme (type II secretory pathway)